MTDTNEYTGGSVRYYTVSVTHPICEAADPYDAECIDIIDALQMTPNEANAFKALWRRAAARLGKSKRGYTDGLYDAEKVEFYGRRLVELEQRERKAAGAEQLPLAEVGNVWDLIANSYFGSSAAVELNQPLWPAEPGDLQEMGPALRHRIASGELRTCAAIGCSAPRQVCRLFCEEHTYADSRTGSRRGTRFDELDSFAPIPPDER